MLKRVTKIQDTGCKIQDDIFYFVSCRLSLRSRAHYFIFPHYSEFLPKSKPYVFPKWRENSGQPEKISENRGFFQKSPGKALVKK
jgi:hypothetical protein